MAYTVKKLADLSGVSVRTLHFYDECGLLKPSWVGSNGYRYYGETELLRLQQILFYRELGFELKKIQQILDQKKFDLQKALKSHRQLLEKKLGRTRQLIETIDATLNHLKGKRKMKPENLFKGFDPKKQAEHEKYLIDRYGDRAREHIAESRKNMGNWNKEKWEKISAEFVSVCQGLAQSAEKKASPDSPEVQALVRRHFTWLKNFWKPKRESYIGHSELIQISELRKAYDAYNPDIADLLCSGIRIFAEKEL